MKAEIKMENGDVISLEGAAYEIAWVLSEMYFEHEKDEEPESKSCAVTGRKCEPLEMDAAVRRHFHRWIETPRVEQRCGCGGKMIYTDTRPEGDIYRCIGRRHEKGWCDQGRVI